MPADEQSLEEERERAREALERALTKENIVRESEWSREYRVGDKSFHIESKFMKDGLEVSAGSLKQRWPSFSRWEKLTSLKLSARRARFSIRMIKKSLLF